MANLKSSIKDIRRTKRRTILNKARRTRLDTGVRAVKEANSREEANLALVAAVSLLDRAAQSNLIHWRNAARQKSRLSHSVNAKFPAAAK